MIETETKYILKDKEDGEITKVTYISRACGCMMPGCVDDELQVHEIDGTYKAQIPRGEIEGVIRGLLDGDYEILEPPNE